MLGETLRDFFKTGPEINVCKTSYIAGPKQVWAVGIATAGTNFTKPSIGFKLQHLLEFVHESVLNGIVVVSWWDLES